MTKVELIGSKLTIGHAGGDGGPVFPPTIRTQAAALIRAILDWFRDRCRLVSEEEHLFRSVICSLCPSWDARHARCLQCGCRAIKLRLRASRCPLLKWGPAAQSFPNRRGYFPNRFGFYGSAPKR